MPVSIGVFLDLGMNTFLWNWIPNFLTERPQSIMLGTNIYTEHLHSTGVCAETTALMPAYSWLCASA